VCLTVPCLGGDAVLLGAAESIWQELLADPVSGLKAAVRLQALRARLG
jgi:hypothetical protein